MAKETNGGPMTANLVKWHRRSLSRATKARLRAERQRFEGVVQKAANNWERKRLTEDHREARQCILDEHDAKSERLENSYYQQVEAEIKERRGW